MKFFLAVALVLSVRTARADDAPSDADIKKFLAFFDKLADTAVADKGKCPQMGTDLNAIIDKNADVMAMAEKAKSSGKKLPQDAQQHIIDTAKRMMPPIMECKDDASVKKALGRLKMGPPRGQSK